MEDVVLSDSPVQEAEKLPFHLLFEHAPDAHFIMNSQHFIACNRAFVEMIGVSDKAQVYHMHPSQISPERQPDGISSQQKAEQMIRTALETGCHQFEWIHQRINGEEFPVEVTLNRMTCNQQTLIYGNWRDISERKQLEQQQALLQQQVIDAQRDALRELSTPLIPLTDHVIAMPLIGTVDSERAQQVIEALLWGITHYHARIALLDITGISLVDTQVAQTLVQSAQAARLLGARVVLTGIGPAMAQTLVNLGADLERIITLGSFQQGVAYALKHRRTWNGGV
jgi:PAS domain S-box-containing protein